MPQTASPFRQFVLKIHNRCDLACDHCYVFRNADQSWRTKPKSMSIATVERVAARIAGHAHAQRLNRVDVILHGGEPLLAGPVRLTQIAEILNSAIAPVCDLQLRIHTNGLLLDETMCEVFSGHNIKVGVSLDGGRDANDRHRRYANGASSFDRVIRAIERLGSERYRHLFSGLLCTIDLMNDPVDVYETLLSFRPPQIDFLLPHATWESPPPRQDGLATGYADWLIAVFRKWDTDGRPVSVRIFDSIMRTTVGYPSLTEAIGFGRADLAVIETDGSYEQVDSLKAAFDGAAATGLNVAEHSLDDLAGHPALAARQPGTRGLSADCAACTVLASCGGGLYAHRYKQETGYLNPSVYCADLKRLIGHVRDRVLPPGAALAGPAPKHGLSRADFGTLAAGFADGPAVERLVQSQRSLCRGLLATVYGMAQDVLARRPDGGRPHEDLPGAWAQLADLDRRDTGAVDMVLGHPYVRVWAARCVKSLSTGTVDGVAQGAGEWRNPEIGYIGGVVAAAAARAGSDAEVMIPIRGRAVHIPALGRLMVGASGGTAHVRVVAGAIDVRTEDGHWVIPPAATAGGHISRDAPLAWQPVRHLNGSPLSVAIEDTDPYRDCHQWTPSPRLAEADVGKWNACFEAAWQLMGSRHPEYLPGLTAGLRAIMPLRPEAGKANLGSAVRHAFGAVGMTLPRDAQALAVRLIHEFQHVKLGAVLDLYDLYDRGDTRLFHAPWRADPRPIGALLQGAYAHVAVTRFWAAERDRRRSAADRMADRGFTLFRRWTVGALATLAESGSLTELGERFVNGMQETLALLK